MIFLLLILHGCFFVLVLALRLLGVLSFPLPFLSMALFLPFAGEAACIVMDALCRNQREGSRSGNVEAMRRTDLWDRIAPHRTPEPENVVPVTDALALDSAREKRDVLMQVIMREENTTAQSSDASRRYADILTQARSSGDTEVVHYAATAITHMQDTIEAEMHICDQKLADAPDDDEILGTYAGLLERGLRSEVWSGQMMEIQRTHLQQILKKRYQLFHREKDGLHLVSALLDAGLCSAAWSIMQEMGISRKPVEELSDTAYMTCLRYAYETREEESFQKLLSDKKAEGGYQTGQIRSVLQFFCKEEQDTA